MDQPINPSNDSNGTVVSAREVHEDNIMAFRVGNKARFLLNRGLLCLYERRLYLSLEYPSILLYAEENFGFCESQTYESLRVADKLRMLPRLTQAFQAGKTFWSAIREITRIAEPQTEEVWLQWAQGKSVRAVTQEVRAAAENGTWLPRKGKGGLPNLFVTIVFSLTLEEQKIVQVALAKMAAEMQERLGLSERPSAREALLFLARLILETKPGGSLLGRSAEAGKPYHILYRHCDACRESWLVTREGEVKVPRESLERVADRAETVRIRPEEELPSMEDGKDSTRIDRKNTASLVRKVLHRDGLACKNCGKKLNLQADHRKERSKGGRTELAQLDTLCDVCHALKSSGHLIPEKDASGETVYRRKEEVEGREGAETKSRKLAAEEEKLDEALRRCAAESTRIESVSAPLPRPSQEPAAADGLVEKRLIEDAVSVLRRMGIFEAVARRKVMAAVEKVKACGKAPSSRQEFIQMACGCL